MEESKEAKEMNVKNLKLLFGRLQKAKEQADQLKQELFEIKTELEKTETWGIFEKYFIRLQHEAPSTSKEGDEVAYRMKVVVGGSSSSKKAKIDFLEENGYVVVYTDGACENNGGTDAKAGFGVWFGPYHPLNVSKPVVGRASNNTAEIQACIAAVTVAKQQNVEKLKIITDSQFTINSVTKWLEGWKKKGWKLSNGKDVKNKVDFEKLDAACQGIDVKWEHVSAHKGIEGNEKADKLAREGAKLYK